MNTLVCLPTFNEEQSIAEMIRGVREIGLDMIVCDGFSNDGTVRIAGEMDVPVIRRKTFGKGSAILTALNYAVEHQYRFLATIDCDLTYEPADLLVLNDHAAESDLVVGLRPLEDLNFPRKLANWSLNTLMKLLYGYPSKDVASGLRLLRVSKFHGCLNANGFEIEPQIYAVAIKKNYRIQEIPVNYEQRRLHSKVKYWHLAFILMSMVRERFRR